MLVPPAMRLALVAGRDRASREAAADAVRHIRERFPHVALTDDILASADALLLFGDDRFILDSLLDGNPKTAVLPMGQGFLAECSLDGIETAIENLVTGKHRIDERLRLELRVDGIRFPPALNEIALTTSRGGGFLRYSLEIDGESVWRDAGDGVIVSTPTGSTAYSLSAGGPVIMENADALVVVPICSNEGRKPLVIPRRSVITLSAIESRLGREIVIDGRRRVRVGDAGLTVRASENPARFVRFGKARYLRVFGKLEARQRGVEMPMDAPPSAKFVYRLLLDQGALSEQQIVRETRLAERTARSALNYLVQRQIVRRLPSLRDVREAIFALAP